MLYDEQTNSCSFASMLLWLQMSFIGEILLKTVVKSGFVFVMAERPLCLYKDLTECEVNTKLFISAVLFNLLLYGCSRGSLDHLNTNH